MSVRIFNYYRKDKNKDGTKKEKVRTMIIGAGSAGSILLNELSASKTGTNQVVCLIDDNKEKKGRYLRDIPIVGGREKIQEAADLYKVEEIILAIPSSNEKTLSDILEYCNETDAKVRILPSLRKSLTGNLAVNLRDISYQDLLGRQEIIVNKEGIQDFIYQQCILVTGGGGSIGSELCRQIARAKPKQLIVYDIYENNAYELQMELLREHPQVKVDVIIGSVRDYDRFERVFRQYHPDIVYHAAAHKHVPLMEVSPNEAVKNNCLGTLNASKLSDEYHVKKFVLISTDKAVRPTNVMGATKRICEMIVQRYSKKSKTSFAAVRFGNVLGSNGSVIPLFLRQIEKGGPVTVTHREITRFFMTIPEAVSLVLQAGLYADGGEIFVLDMGEQVKIYDLAENLIKFKGYKPGIDIPIEVVGLRPGEKLYEEILMDEEGLERTENNSIFIGKPISFDHETFDQQLEDLIEKAYSNLPEIKEEVAKVCSTYVITDHEK